MASSTLLHSLLHIPPRSSTRPRAQLLPSKPISRLNNPAPFARAGAHHGPIRRLGGRRSSTVVASQSNFLKEIVRWQALKKFAQTVWKVGRDAIEAGTNLVPDAVPRPVARISVTFVGLSVALFVLKSFLSTAFFVLATMGLIYFTFLALNKDNGPKGGGDGPKGGGAAPPMDDPMEEARKIMEKYK
ncbi:hypothetical protein EUGRSUZ_C02436 [Eucalyptus grandis]|uniref:Uncharacterized protein n=2 Tax=Eucalyptus grandis TaxID=71139 RepID=A0A059CSB0_EUCGR|nr:hypothetical protein EUGRSUZ_C02436 [Eucalyptus grandis]